VFCCWQDPRPQRLDHGPRHRRPRPRADA
jgi:hypothetical protein